MPKDLSFKLHKFVEFNKQQSDIHRFQPSMNANMDETPIWADMPSDTTIDQTSVHSVPIRTTGHEKN